MLLNSCFVRAKIIFTLFTLLIISCTSRQVEETLSDVESYIKERPDSALMVLDSMDRDLLTTRKLRSHHALLHATALDKNFIDVADDSLALVALDWYDKHGDKKYKARSLYYLGLSYYYKGDYYQSILKLTEAEEVAMNCDSLYWALSKSLQGYTYSKTYNNVEELNCVRKAYEIYSGLSESYYMDVSYYRLGRIHMNQLRYEEANLIFTKLLSRKDELSDWVLGNTMCSYAYLKVICQESDPQELILLYDDIIDTYGYRYMTENDWWAYSSVLSSLGRKVESQGIIDQLELKDTTSTPSYWKYFISKNEGDMISALKFLEESCKKDNEIIDNALSQSLALTQRDYYEAQSDLAHYKIKIRTLITLITIAFTVLLIVILFVVIASRIRKYKEEKEKYIQYVEEMTRQLNEIQKEEVPSLKRKYLELYKKKFADLRVLCDTYLQFQGRDNAEKMMYSRVVAMVNELKVDMQDHLKLEAMLDEDLNGVMTALRREVKMKEIDYIIFAYIALGFDATTISRLIDTSVNTVYIRKSRIKKLIEESDISFKDTFMVILS